MVEQIENRVARLEDKFSEVDRKLERFTVMVENSTRVQEETRETLSKLGDVLTSVQLSMTKMQGELAANTQEILEFRGELKSVKEDAKKEQERGTIHLMDIIRENWWKIGLVLILATDILKDTGAFGIFK